MRAIVGFVVLVASVAWGAVTPNLGLEFGSKESENRNLSLIDSCLGPITDCSGAITGIFAPDCITSPGCVIGELTGTIGFFGATPVGRQSASTALMTGMQNLGLFASGTYSGAVTTTGAISGGAITGTGLTSSGHATVSGTMSADTMATSNLLVASNQAGTIWLNFADNSSSTSYTDPTSWASRGKWWVGKRLASGTDQRRSRLFLDTADRQLATSQDGTGGAVLTVESLDGPARLILRNVYAPERWKYSAGYLAKDPVIPDPPNGDIYWSSTAGVSAATQPFATTAKPAGWPKGWRPYASFVAGERVKLMASNGHKYVVNSASCTVGANFATQWWVPAATYGTSGGAAVTDGSCSLTEDGSDHVSSVTDGTLSWDYLQGQNAETNFELMGGNSQTGIHLRHSDNEWLGYLSLTRANAPGSGTPIDTTMFGLFQGDLRARGPVVYQFTEDPWVSTSAFIGKNPAASGVGQPYIYDPYGKPTIVAGSGGSPGLAQGCYWAAYAWESTRTGGRTRSTPIEHTDGVYVDGTTNNKITITAPVAAYPDSTNARLVIYAGLGSRSGTTCTIRPPYLLRVKTLTTPTLSYVYAGCASSCEHEVPFNVNDTFPHVVEMGQGITGTAWAATTVYKTRDVRVPTSGNRNGHVYIAYANTSTGNEDNSDTLCTSGNAEPTWDTTPGGFTNDTAGGGTCRWRELGFEKPPLTLYANDTSSDIVQVRERLDGAHTGRIKLGIDENGALYGTTVAASSSAVTKTAAFSGTEIRLVPPTAQAATGGFTIAADACGSIKRLSNGTGGSVTTSTTNTFTAPASTNAGCMMTVCNTSANAIVLDNNANFATAGGADATLTNADDCVDVASDGVKWRQMGAVVSNS